MKNIAYWIYKKLVMQVVEPSLSDVAKNTLFRIYKRLIMDIVDPEFSYVMEKFS